MYICKRNFMTMKRIWTIEVSQNGWEYIGIVTITAVSVERSGAYFCKKYRNNVKIQ